jgi:hypothetical protein
MDAGTVSDSRAYWDSVAVETARKHPLAVATWLVLDVVLSAAVAAQDAIETRMRAEVAQHGGGNIHARR